MEGDFGGTFGGAAPVVPGLPQPNVDYPSGDFDPAKWRDKTIEMWAHDETVEAGKTYQYRIRYKIRNPVFAQPNAVNNPQFANVFALVSPWSEWASPVTIPQLVNFFVQSAKLGGTTVRFDVYRWHEGQTHAEQFTVGPGDQIGTKKGEIDYSTDWTVVDFRDDPRQGETQIILFNNKDGSFTVRSYAADRNDALYKQLQDQMKQQKLAETAAAAVNGGVAPPVR
jgi:hypothetical protein